MRAFSSILLVLLLTTSTAPIPVIAKPRDPPATATYRYYFPLVFSAESPVSKKGVGLTYGVCDDMKTLRATWYYSWRPRSYSCAETFYPMIWGRFDEVPDVDNSDYLLGFNEPDRSNQANITPTDAARLWRQIELRYPDRRLVSPAPSQTNLNWLVQFRDAYIAAYDRPPRLDALAAHCYSADAEPCIALLGWYKHSAMGWGIGEIWLTEFAVVAQPSRAFNDTAIEIRELLTWLENEKMVTRYAWFASRVRGDESCCRAPSSWETTSLTDILTNRLSPYGRIYADR